MLPISVKVKVIAPFPIRGLDPDDWLELSDGSRVKDVLKGSGLNPVRLLPVFVNGHQVKKSHALKDGDIVVFLYPLSGG
jgi:molybdopterin converting factor small subunit